MRPCARISDIGSVTVTVAFGCTESNCFVPHELRSRPLRYMVGTAVICVRIVLARWRCTLCGRTFTDYPDFRTAV